ncbi:hypothetical protein SADO_04150 [Salinisphaera dokdonensis CL-ES53]|uniref:Lipoprotein n=2 Tax=Salinisphaera TaxID=180541 RepID=A0ABV2AZ50_9GAMM
MLAGCASTPVYDFVDPAHRDARYDGFLAYAAFEDLALRAAFEDAVCTRLFKAGHACETMLSAAPPTREQDAASRHAASRRSGAQATLLINVADTQSPERASLAHGQPAYEISLLDNARQEVVARFATESQAKRGMSTRKQADRLARRLVGALERESLLFERP